MNFIKVSYEFELCLNYGIMIDAFVKSRKTPILSFRTPRSSFRRSETTEESCSGQAPWEILVFQAVERPLTEPALSENQDFSLRSK